MAYPPPHGYQQGYGGQQPPYPPPQQQHHQQPYGYGPPNPGYPPQGYPPQQQPYGQAAYPPHHQGHSPHAQSPYPPQPQAYGQYPPPVHGHPNAHSPHPQAPYPPQPPQPPQPYGATPQAYGAPAPYAGPPSVPSPGYDPRVVPQTDMNGQAMALRDAMKGFGTNEKRLIETLAAVPDAPHMLKLRHTYDDRFRRSLIKDIEGETSGHFRDGLVALCRGPLLQDACQVEKAVRGLGTKESLLNDVVLGRSNADMHAIKACYTQVFGKDMAREIREDLSLSTARLFDYVLVGARAEESAPVLPHDVEHNVDRIQQATMGTKMGTNQDVVSHVMASSSDGMIRAINIRYQTKYRTDLDTLYKNHFSGHMQDALRQMAARAVDPVKSDAMDLERSMKGLGTRDDLLVTRLVRCHWDRNRMHQVKAAYRTFHNRDLSARVSGETSGDYKRLMVALCS